MAHSPLLPDCPRRLGCGKRCRVALNTSRFDSDLKRLKHVVSPEVEIPSDAPYN